MGQRGGYHLWQSLLRLQHQWQLQAEYNIEAVDCLSGCNRACEIAFAAPNKTTLMFGDLPPLQSASAILKLAEQYHTSPDGIVPRQEHPELLKKGILATIPPLLSRTEALEPQKRSNFFRLHLDLLRIFIKNRKAYLMTCEP